MNEHQPRAFGSASQPSSNSKSFFQYIFDGKRAGSVSEISPSSTHFDTTQQFKKSTSNASMNRNKSWTSSVTRRFSLSTSNHGKDIQAAQNNNDNSNNEVVQELLLQQLKLYENIINQQAQLIKSNNEIFSKIASIEERSSLLQGGKVGELTSLISTHMERGEETSTILQTSIHNDIESLSSQSRSHFNQNSLKLGVEMASGFSLNKFASTLAVVRQTQVPPSHSLCFMYTSMQKARQLIDNGECPSVFKAQGVPLTLCGPDERFDSEYRTSENQWLYNATHIGEVIYPVQKHVPFYMSGLKYVFISPYLISM